MKHEMQFDSEKHPNSTAVLKLATEKFGAVELVNIDWSTATATVEVAEKAEKKTAEKK